MAKTRFIQNAFTSGVLSPLLKGRDDLEQYYKGLEVGTNVVLLPQGGLRRRPGTNFTETALHKLARNTVTITMPNGGTQANIDDDDDSTNTTTTTNISTVSPYIVASVNIGTVATIAVIDVRGIFLTSGLDASFRVEYQFASVWYIAGKLPTVGTNPQDFRVRAGVQSGHGQPLLWRLVRSGSDDLGTAKVTLSVFSFWEETATISALSLKDFSIDADTHFLLAFTENNVRIFSGPTGNRVADIRTNYTDAQIGDIRDFQSESVMLLFHEDVESQRIINLGEAFAWTTDTVPFTNIPQFDYNDELSPTPTSDVQIMIFVAFVAGDTFQIDIEGVLSKNITFAGDASADERSATATNIEKNIQEMPVVGATGVSVARTGVLAYTITISGESAKDFELFSAFATSGTASKTITFTKSANGVPRKEDLWSATRGYPKTACFYSGRLVLGGTKSKPQSLLLSKAGQAFDFELGEGDDNDAIFVTISSRKLNNITDVFPGRNLEIFTGGSEFTVDVKPITPTTIDITPQPTEHGSLNIEVKSIGGATLFLDRNGKSLKSYLYNFNEDAYSANDISVLSPELIKTPVDLDILGGTSSDDANWVFIVNNDGTATVLNTLRAQDINGFTEWTTSGSLVSAVVVDDQLYQANLRTIGGVQSYFIERWSFDNLLDNSLIQSAGTSIDNLDHLEGETVTVVADGITLGHEFVVTSGSIALTEDEQGHTNYEAGINFMPAFKGMPISTNIGSGRNPMRLKKLVRMNIRVLNTGGLKIEGEPIPVRSLSEGELDSAPDVQTGIISDVFDLTGWDRDAMPLFTQDDPAPMTILSIEYEVESS